MPVLNRHSSSSFSRDEFNQWLNQRRAEEGMEPVVVPSGRPIFKSWLRDAWKFMQDLPEAQGLGLFCERDVTMVVCEHFEDAAVGGQLCPLTVFEVLPLNRPKRVEALSPRLRQLSG